MEDGYHLVQIHAVDFSDDGDIVLQLLRSINVESGEAGAVHKALNGGQLRFVGLKDGQYVYIEKGQKLVIQSGEAPVPASARFQPS